MNENDIQAALQDALEDQIPASKIDLWSAIEDQLVAGKLIPQQGDKMNNIYTQRGPRLAFAIVILLALLSIFLLTPQGRSFAQTIVNFFTPVENNGVPQPVAPQSGNAIPSTESTAMPPASLVTVADAEIQIGFSVAELTNIPDGLHFLGARVYNNSVNLEYETQDKAGHLIVAQSQEGFYQSEWDLVPESAVTQVEVSGMSGEIVAGTFVLYPGATQGNWNPDADILRLRWEREGILYEITKYGSTEAINYLDQDALIKIGESLEYKH